jgi:outer membrane protein assembly factor BamB
MSDTGLSQSPLQASRLARVWRVTAWVAGVFSLVVGVAMIVGNLGARAEDPLKSPLLKEYKEKLRLNPLDEQMKQRVRALDLQLRQKYFSQLSRRESGVYLLLAGVVAFVLATTQATRCQRRLPSPEARLEDSERVARAAARARWSIAGAGVVVGVFLLVLGFGPITALPKGPAGIEKLLGGSETATAPDAASPEELKRNWPRFHGADGGGVSAFTNAPAAWDPKTGKNIAWKVPSPTSGFGSPIVWGDRVIFSGGDAAHREVVCLSAQTGQTLWRQAVTNVPGSPQAVEVPDSTGYAASTMATDGRRAYVFFANGDCAALTLDGKPVWAKSFGPLKNAYGFATSLATWQDRLILLLDQGEPDEGRSKLYALDGRTGKVVWERPRKVGASWASPIVIEAAGKPQVIALAVPWVIAYSAKDGTELWRVEGLNGEITPSPIFAGGLVIVPSPSEKLMAIRPDGTGDVTKTHVVWTDEDNVPDVTSPTSNGELVFALTTGGMLSCFDGKDGKKIWDHDYDMECHASPSLVGNRVYMIGMKGTAVVVEAARQFKELFRTDMPDAFHASPAFAQDKMFLRGVTNIWSIGEVRSPKSEVPGGAK